MSELSWGLRIADRQKQGQADDPASLGVDVSALPSLGRRFRLIGGAENLSEALARRLQTPRGALHYAPNYGTDIREFLNDEQTPATLSRVQTAIANELQKDPRVDRVTVVARFDAVSEALRVDVGVWALTGPFSLILNVTQLTVEILNGDES